MTDLICITCPRGCHLSVAPNGEIKGAGCEKGIAYGREELTNPMRVLTSTVVIEGSFLPRLPVKSEHPIPKRLLREAAKRMDCVRVQSPVHVGEVLVENLLETGVNVVATREM